MRLEFQVNGAIHVAVTPQLICINTEGLPLYRKRPEADRMPWFATINKYGVHRLLHLGSYSGTCTAALDTFPSSSILRFLPPPRHHNHHHYSFQHTNRFTASNHLKDSESIVSKPSSYQQASYRRLTNVIACF
jgi:hypothetical protein